MTNLSNFITDILEAPGNVELVDNISDVDDTATRLAMAETLVHKYFTDEVLAKMVVETGGHDDFNEIMTLAELDELNTERGLNPHHNYSYDSVRRRLVVPTASCISMAERNFTEQASESMPKPYDAQQVAEMFKLFCNINDRACKCCGNKIEVPLDLEAGKFIATGDGAKVNCPGKHLTPESFEFSAPSGKIVVAGELTSLFPEQEFEFGTDEYETYNNTINEYYRLRGADPLNDSLLGKRAVRDFFLKEHNMVSLEVPNIDLGIYAGEGLLKIRREFENYDDYDAGEMDELEDYELEEIAESAELTTIGTIESGSFAVHIMDYDVFCQYVADMGGKPKKLIKELNALVLDAPLNDMTITDHYTVPGVDEGDSLMATIHFGPQPKNTPPKGPGI